MRIECPSCKILSVASISKANGREVSFVCSGCHSEYTEAVESPLSKTVQPKAEAGGTSCPKCYANVPVNKNACTTCGLAVSHFSSFENTPGGGDKGFSGSWNILLSDWQNNSAHQQFIADVAASGDFRGGAAKYRDAAVDKSKAQRCEEMLQSIQKMATAALMSSKPKVEDEEEPYSKVMIMLVLFVVLAGVGAIYAMMQTSGQSGENESGVQRPISPPKNVPGPRGR